MKIVLNLLLVVSYMFLTQGLLSYIQPLFAQSGLLVTLASLFISIALLRQSLRWRIGGFIIMLFSLSGLVQQVSMLNVSPLLGAVIVTLICGALMLATQSRTLAVITTVSLSHLLPYASSYPVLGTDPLELLNTLAQSSQGLAVFSTVVLYAVVLLALNVFRRALGTRNASLVRTAQVTSLVLIFISLTITRSTGTFFGIDETVMMTADLTGYLPFLVGSTLILPPQFMLILLVLALLGLGSYAKRNKDHALFTVATVFSLFLLFREWFNYFDTVNPNGGLLGAGLVGVVLVYLFGRTECCLDTCEMKVSSLPAQKMAPVARPMPVVKSAPVVKAPVKTAVVAKAPVKKSAPARKPVKAAKKPVKKSRR